MLNNQRLNVLLGLTPVARRNHLVRMRIAEALKDGEWHSVDAIVDRFICEGWSFINGKQLTLLCKCEGIEIRHRRNSAREFRLANPTAFYEWMNPSRGINLV
jgi:hypothetical protein